MPVPVPYRVYCYAPMHPLFAKEETTFEQRLEYVLSAMKDKPERVFAPQVEGRAGVRGHFRDFTSEALRCGVTLLTSDVPAHLLSIHRHEALAVSSGGNPLIVATSGDYMIGGSATPESLLQGGHQGVIDEIRRYFDEKGVAGSNIMIRLYFFRLPIACPLDPNHPEKGKRHLELLETIEKYFEKWNLRKDGTKKEETGDWTKKEETIVTKRDGIPHLNIYLLARAIALSVGIRKVGCDKQLPSVPEFDSKENLLLINRL